MSILSGSLFDSQVSVSSDLPASAGGAATASASAAAIVAGMANELRFIDKVSLQASLGQRLE